MSDLRGTHPLDSYERLLVLSGSDQLTNGTGSKITELDITASYSVSASYEILYEESSSYADTAVLSYHSLQADTSSYFSGSQVIANNVVANEVTSSKDIVTYGKLIVGSGATIEDDGAGGGGIAVGTIRTTSGVIVFGVDNGANVELSMNGSNHLLINSPVSASHFYGTSSFSVSSSHGITSSYSLSSSFLIPPAVSTISTVNIDWSISDTFEKTLSSNTTFTFSNSESRRMIIVKIRNSIGDNYTVTWPSIKWPGGSVPVQSVNGKEDIYTFMNINGTFYGNVTQNFDV